MCILHNITFYITFLFKKNGDEESPHRVVIKARHSENGISS